MDRPWWVLEEDVPIDWHSKAFGPDQQGRTVGELVAAGTTVADLPTPLLTLDASALEHNVAAMGEWTRRHGVDLAPHGKTTMCPALWRRQLDAGAWAITVATPWQLRVAVAAGVKRIMHAGAIVDARELAALRRLLDGDPELQVIVWADSPETVDLLVSGYPRGGRPLRVLAERGGPGARTGARSSAEAVETARAISGAAALRLAGVAAWEGSLQAATGPHGRDAVASFCDGVADAFVRIEAEGLFTDPETPVITAGGSAFFDIVTERWEFLAAGPARRARVVLRSGCYLTHDDGGYAKSSPFARAGSTPLTPALHAWAQVVSRPEPTLALLNAGRRDVPYDGLLPVPQRIRGRSGDDSARALRAATVSMLNDQHAYLSLAPESDVRIGDVIRLGISHPCTAFDKWTVIPVIDRASASVPKVIGAVRTVF
ncbi:MAG TPA: amino acid deaminase [Trebonia sp.]|nr:amino acid deaminase [Trebonia sp.]